MDLIIKNNIMPADYKALCKDAGWPFLRDFEIVTLLNNSTFKVSIYDGDNLVGMGRVVSDTTKIFLLCDIIVKIEYQKKGIGRIIVDNLINKINKKSANSDDVYIYIMSAKGKEGFYEKVGFTTDIKTGLTYKRGN